MLALVTNDDGVNAKGLVALKDALVRVAEVVVVAPDREMSAVSRAITMKRPLRMKEVGERVYAVDGTPVDCVYMALYHVLDRRPDIVVSGINRGPNVGDDVSYSGTVAAAAEAALAGIPSFAISLNDWRSEDYQVAARFAAALAPVLVEMELPERTFLNVNVPVVSPGSKPGYTFTVQCRRRYPQEVDARTDPRGFPYYWIGGGNAGTWEQMPGTDGDALDRGLISITPLKLDATAHELLEPLKGWKFPGFDPA